MNVLEFLTIFIGLFFIYKIVEQITYAICWTKSDNVMKEKILNGGKKELAKVSKGDKK